MTRFARIPEAIADIKKGKLLILLDDPARENEADLYVPTDTMTPAHIKTMISFGGGLICTAITKAQAHRLSLPLMVAPSENKEKTGVSFTVSVNARRGITTGVSAFDRAKTINILADSKSRPRDLVRPGHMFGLVGKPGGVLERNGHTEAAIDLARLAGFSPSGVISEMVGTNGKMAGRNEIAKLSKKLNIKMVLVRDLVTYLKQNPLPSATETPDVARSAEAELPTAYGTFRITVYESALDRREHVALVFGKPKEPATVRIHSQCITGDTFFSKRCDCGEQLRQSMKRIRKIGSGVILYLSQEGRDIGLTNKIRAYALQARGYDTVEANHALGLPTDARDYKIAADMLKDLHIQEICLLTNNPDKEKQLISQGIRIVKRVPLESAPNVHSARYLRTKKQKMGHRLKRI
ncbi:hypothetical protein A2841_02650 [Candidatus Kaiserbacteria bacterium RIFCSPHIGHO2_01_FULL_48_10]|uniref:GTP cyclohydrolase-2 n=1 Tax=Candidatus Kaiserbacteria bacterium RIFCSPHIGHO2_01_FULL_48_10 TaxID=1798476 RepID=A0A1F6C2E3_9BACT|nr:MAG: hypothetical protein A2841_02650 [Candidatus Kaiserbacteria bacterium RIFCSPHIGHO2_01_FULL_48_10]